MLRRWLRFTKHFETLIFEGAIEGVPRGLRFCIGREGEGPLRRVDTILCCFI
jgi:hypothetical protein